MIAVFLYGRDNCHLCDQAKEDLEKLKEHYPHELRIVNIDHDQELQKKYGTEIPVVEIGPYLLRYPFSYEDLKITLNAALDRVQHIEQIERDISQTQTNLPVKLSRTDKFSFWLAKHYMAMFNTIVTLYLGFAFLTPLLMRLGYVSTASVLYKAYGMVCHQLAFRSWFLFGEQLAYPRSAAHVQNLIPYNQATGLDESDLFSARDFIGNSVVGYKVALCQRDVAIYGGILLFGLVFSIARCNIKPLPWYIWVVFGILPVGIDGLSQLLSQPPFSNIIMSLFSFTLPYRESTPLLRTLTGGLFGLTTAWFGYPLVEESMVETRDYVLNKLSQIERQKTVEIVP